MKWHVTAVEVPGLYFLDVTFKDGTRRQVDMEPELWGELLKPLRDPALFAQAYVDPELRTVAWPNGADIFPEFLYYGDDYPDANYLTEESSEEPALVTSDDR